MSAREPISVPPQVAAVAPDGRLTPRQRRRLKLQMVLRRQKPGTGSAQDFLRRRTAVIEWPDLRSIFSGIDWLVVGGVATRAYMAERMTKDIDILVRLSDGEAAVDAARRLRPDLILLDISMPGLDGLQALRRIKDERPEVQVVMLTVSDDDSTLFEALRSGAQGYLLKSLAAGEFLAMIEGLERGEAAVTRKTAARLIEGLARTGERPPEAADQLTPRERELLALVARGLSNKAIAEKMTISENTVKYYMKNILQKLGAQNRTEAAAHALRSGLVPLDPS